MVRFPALAVPAILLLAGAFYFFGTPKKHAPWTAGNAAAAEPAADDVADEYDREIVRALLDAKNLREDQSDLLLQAAGRRYMRRKLAYTAAMRAGDAGKAASGEPEALRRDMEAARKVCDVAELLGRHTPESTLRAAAGWELENRLAYMPSAMAGLVERHDGAAVFTEADLGDMEQAFREHFGRPLPVSARGGSAVHRAMGFDHSGRFDIAVSPSHAEGVWAGGYLTEKHATFFMFRGAIPGKATGAHIHIGPPSARW
jgi:hypothetical protein